MRVLSAFLVSAAVALAAPGYLVGRAVDKAIAARQENGKNGAYDLALIPAGCDVPCTTYKQIFGTCPGNPTDAVCAKACNQSVHNEFNVCMSCVVNNGPAAGLQAHEIDILNIAQQQLVQQCIEAGAPASFSGTVVLPSTVAYPSGIVNATYSVSAASTSAAAPSSSAPAASASASAPATEPKPAAAGSLRPAAALAVFGVAIAAVL